MNMQHGSRCTLRNMAPDRFGPIPEETKPYLAKWQNPSFLIKLRKYRHRFTRPYPSPPEFDCFCNYRFLTPFDEKRHFLENRKESPPFAQVVG